MYYLVVVRYRLRFWAGLSWRTPTARRALQYFAAGLFLGVAVLFAPNLLPSRDDFPLRKLFSSPGAAYAIALFAVLVAPLIEELIFRGVLFSFFERLVGLWFAIVATALLFAGLHVPEYWGAWNGLLLVSLAGGVFSLARGLTGSLAPSVILHLAYNASLMVSLFYSTRHFHSLGATVLP
jgi:membrane protease YdiL (CAAX protease family)